MREAVSGICLILHRDKRILLDNYMRAIGSHYLGYSCSIFGLCGTFELFVWPCL